MERITVGERVALYGKYKSMPITPPKGQPMPQTMENWKNLAELYGKTIQTQTDEIILLKQRVNKLEQRK